MSLFKFFFVTINFNRRDGEVAAAMLTDYKRGLKTDVDTEGTLYKYLDESEKQIIQEYNLISVVGIQTFKLFYVL